MTGNVPHSGRRKQRASLIDPYKSYLLKRWQQGCRNGAELERELRAKGYARIATRSLPLSGDFESIALCILQAQKGLNSVQSVLDSLGITGHLALFPKARGFRARGAGEPPAVEAGKSSP